MTIFTSGTLSLSRVPTRLDEAIVFCQLNEDETAIWSLLLAGGYLKVENYTAEENACLCIC